MLKRKKERESLSRAEPNSAFHAFQERAKPLTEAPPPTLALFLEPLRGRPSHPPTHRAPPRQATPTPGKTAPVSPGSQQVLDWDNVVLRAAFLRDPSLARRADRAAGRRRQASRAAWQRPKDAGRPPSHAADRPPTPSRPDEAARPAKHCSSLLSTLWSWLRATALRYGL